MKIGKTKYMALLLSVLLITGTVARPVFAFETGAQGDMSENEEAGVSENSDNIIVDKVSNSDLSDIEVQENGTGNGKNPQNEEEPFISYTVTLDANGGFFKDEWDDIINESLESAVVLNKVIPAGGVITTFPVKDKENDSPIFLGWTLEKNGDLVSQEYEEYIPTEDCVLYAAWSKEDIESDTEKESDNDFDGNPAINDEQEAPNADNESMRDSVSEDDPSTDNVFFTETEPVAEAEQSESEVFTVETQNETDSDALKEVELESDVNSDRITSEDSSMEPYQKEDSTEEADSIKSKSGDVDDHPDNEMLFPVDTTLNNTNEEQEKNTNNGEETIFEESLNYIVESGSCSDDITWTLDEDGTMIISGSGEMEWSPECNNVKTVIIEDGVTSISNYAFYRCTELSSVTIPESVKSIGKEAFSGCHNLHDLIIPSGITHIGESAFQGCESLTDVSVPGGVNSIEKTLFNGCTNLENVTIQNGVTCIEKYAFYNCTSLTKVTIPESVTYIKEGAFQGCNSLENITIPESITYIGDNAFQGCNSLENITIPENITYIGDNAFSGTPWLESLATDNDYQIVNGILIHYQGEGGEIIIPDGVIYIGDYAFRGCNNITKVTISDSVTRIGNYAFGYCENLENVIIPDSVTEIGESAFQSCMCLKDITIPNSVSRIGDYAFRWCNALNRITIQDGVTAIGIGAFYECGNLDSVTIPGSVISIDDSTFSYCSGLTNVTICEGITSIGRYAFLDCNRLDTVAIPDSVEYIGFGAFESCSCLADVVLSKNLKTIGGRAFHSTPWQEAMGDFPVINGALIEYQGTGGDVVIPGSVTTICEDAFSFCSELTSITIPESVTIIGDGAFYYCRNLTRVIIPENIKNIERYAFSDTPWLESLGDYAIVNGILLKYQGNDNVITIPNGVIRIGDGAFDESNRLQHLRRVTIPEGVTHIGNEAFRDCEYLRAVKIPSSVISIGKNAFSYIDHDNYDGETIYCPLDYLTILGVTGSYAEQYAKENGFSFEAYEPPVSISDDALISITDQTYTGNELTPIPVVMLDGISLCPDIDYIVEYFNNTNAGTATVIITGIGNYDGTITNTFKISKAIQTIKASNLTLTYPNSGKIKASGNNGKLTFTSSNTAVAAVDSSGNVTAKGAGSAKVTITAAATSNFKQATKQITVTVAKGTQSITAKAAASSVATGKTTTVSLTGAKGTKSFKSSDNTIATVSSTGKVTAKKVGKVTITATSAATANFNKASASVKINVVPAATTSLTAANQATGIKLTWKKVTGATGYLVYRGSTKIATIKSGATVTYTDAKANTNGTKYTFKIIPTASTGKGPAKSLATYRVVRPAINSVANSAAGKMTVKWGKNTKGTGYQIHYCTDKTFKSGNKSVNITSASTASKVIGSLKKGKTYYVRIRTYKTSRSTKYFSGWSTVKSVKITK